MHEQVMMLADTSEAAKPRPGPLARRSLDAAHGFERAMLDTVVTGPVP